jgi:predicted nicotinamide N-methyase
MAATVPYRSSSKFTIGPLEVHTTAGDSQDDSEDTTGRAAWTAGCKLAELLLLEDKHGVRDWVPPGARVLELGCGCGVAGCAVAARDPSAHVLFTDSSIACLATATRNAARFGARTSTAVLKWGDVDAASRVAETFRPTLVLGTDVGYDPASHEALVKTLAALRTEVVLVEQVRYRDVFDWFLDELERAGFALAGRVDDVGESVCCMRFLYRHEGS